VVRFDDGIMKLPGRKITEDCLRKRANLIGEPVTVMAHRHDFNSSGGFPSHRYYIDLEMGMRLLKRSEYVVISESLCAFQIHGGAVSSLAQGKDLNRFEDLPEARKCKSKLIKQATY